MMRVDTSVTALLAVLLCLIKRAQGITDHNLAQPTGHSLPMSTSFDLNGTAYDTSETNCTALAYVYNVATGNDTNPETFFDGYIDPYQTTGTLSLQLELENFHLEDVDVIRLSYNLTIHNHLYNYMGWTSNYAADPLGELDHSSPRGEAITQVAPFMEDRGHGVTGLTPGYFNMAFYSEAPRTLHTFDRDVLTEALLPERVTCNEVECNVVLACQGDAMDIFPC